MCYVVSPSEATQRSENELIRVVAAVVSRDGELLVCQRPLHKRHGGLWEFPGGKCEPGESDEDALRRELREELGVELASAGGMALEVRDPGSAYLIIFIPVTIFGTAVPLEHAALEWGTPQSVAKLPLAPSDRRFLEHYLARE